MKAFSKTVPLWAVVLILLLSASAVVAAVYYTLEVPSTVRVVSYKIELWNEAKTAQITSFDFGNLNPGESVYSPVFWVKNLGETPVWFGWRCEDLPAGLQLTMEIYCAGNTQWYVAGSGVWVGYYADSWVPLVFNEGIPKNDYTQIKARFKVTHVSSSSGMLSFTIKIDSASTQTG